MEKKRKRRKQKLLKARDRLFKARQLAFKIQEKEREKFQLGSLWDQKEGKQPNGGLSEEQPRRNSCCVSAMEQQLLQG